MEAALSRTSTSRIWISGALALLLSIACAFCYFGYMGQGIAAGALIGLPGREGDVAIAQHRATFRLMASLFCFTTSIVTGTVAFPFPFYPDVAAGRTFRAGFDLVAGGDGFHRVRGVLNYHSVTSSVVLATPEAI